MKVKKHNILKTQHIKNIKIYYNKQKIMVLTINGLTKSEIQLLEAEYNLLSLEYNTGE